MPSKSIIRRIQQTDDDFYPMYDGGEGKPKGKDKYKDDLDTAPKTPSFEGGMNFDRSGCGSDCVWGMIFIAFLASMVFLTYLGFHEGDINKLLAPVIYNSGTDSRELCGYKNDT
jgi:hypothetical protein